MCALYLVLVLLCVDSSIYIVCVHVRVCVLMLLDYLFLCVIDVLFVLHHLAHDITARAIRYVCPTVAVNTSINHHNQPSGNHYKPLRFIIISH